MSGIVGLINLDGQPVDRQLLRQMTDFLAFRGPDSQEIWLAGQVGFGHTMLRTTFEAEAEQQPCSLDGQVWITADARLDGRADLIRRLEDRGCHDLGDVPDPELILHAYRVWGEGCLQYLLGDFAFAIWDGPRRRLFCARDHFGVKPFYYAQVANSLVFSNTLRCVRLHPQVSDRLNDLAIADFLLFEYNQDKATTTFADIQRLPPAHYLTWRPGLFKLQCYWSLPSVEPLHYPNQSDYVEQFQDLLRQAVADRLRTRQVGVTMSGGLDSTTVAAAARSLLMAQAAPFDLRAYSLIYDRLIPDKERHYSGVAAHGLNIPILHLAVDDYNLYERWDQEALHGPEPRHRPFIAIWIDFLASLEGCRSVLLTGEGGDLLLVPSQAYIHEKLRTLKWGQLAVEVGRCLLRYRALPPVGFRTYLQRLRGYELHAYPSWLNPDFAARLDLRARWQQFWHEPLDSHSLRPEFCKYLRGPWWSDYFEKLHDPGGTGLPVELRHPLFDLRLVNFAQTLPPLPWCVDKVLFREAGRGILPEAVRQRPKTTLAGNPAAELLRQDRGKWGSPFHFAPELEQYVDRSALALAQRNEQESEKMLDNLRPLSLNFWLRGEIQQEGKHCKQPKRKRDIVNPR